MMKSVISVCVWRMDIDQLLQLISNPVAIDKLRGELVVSSIAPVLSSKQSHSLSLFGRIQLINLHVYNKVRYRSSVWVQTVSVPQQWVNLIESLVSFSWPVDFRSSNRTLKYIVTDPVLHSYEIQSYVSFVREDQLTLVLRSRANLTFSLGCLTVSLNIVGYCSSSATCGRLTSGFFRGMTKSNTFSCLQRKVSLST